MKVHVVGIVGVCDAALVRSGNCNDMVCRIWAPAAEGTREEVFAERESFRQRCKVAWATEAELAELLRLGFLD